MQKYCSSHWSARKNTQGGAALVVALIILLVVTILGVTGANETQLSENMASNHNTQTKAFFAAQAGIDSAVQVANSSTVAQAVAGGSVKAIKSAWEKAWKNQNSHLTVVNHVSGEPIYKIPVSGKASFKISPETVGAYWNPKNRTFEVISNGSLNSGNKTLSKRTLVAHISPATLSTPNSPFLAALIGRKGVSGGGSAVINSYNSNYGSYGKKVTVNGNKFYNTSTKTPKLRGQVVRTCASGATVTLNGNSPIYGNVLSTGGIKAKGGTPIYGNIHVNGAANFNGQVYGNLTAGGKVTLGNASIVRGYVLSGGNLIAKSQVKGAVKVHGNAFFSNSANVPGGGIIASGNVTVGSSFQNKQPTIKAGGSINYPSYFQYGSPPPSANYHSHLSSSQLSLPRINPVTNKQSNCNKFQTNSQFTQIFTKIRKNSSTQLLSNWLDKNQCKGKGCFSKNGHKLTLKSVNYSGTLRLGTSGQKTLLKTTANVTTAGILSNLDVDGNVTLLVDGNFNLGGSTTLNIGSSDSLKLLVTGTTKLASGSNLNVNGPFVRKNTNGKLVPAVAFYSDYNSSSTSGRSGVTVAGSNSSHLSVYAPKTTVKLAGSGSIYGSVVAQKIKQTGTGTIHYDKALKKLYFGQGGGSRTAAKLISWQQIQG